MPLRVQGRDVILHNGAIAAIAFGSEHIKVIVTAIGFAITFMEAILAELLAALGTEEMFCMPGFVQSSNAFLWKINETK